ncbi:MAG: DUF4876 domain-containing protein [Prevotella sp.]|nr:DUF4876 domain-containing protein [Prevotella sp.]
MKKYLSLALMAVMMLGSAAVVTSCGDDDDEVKTYLLNVNLQLNDGLTLDNISNLKMVVTNSLEQEQTIDLTDVTTTMTVVGGQYDFVVSGKVKDEAAAHATGTASTSVFADTNVTIQVSKSIQGSLVWKTIYTTGAKSGYLKDSYFEIANNSDEVQYLDQVMLFYTSSALTSESAWQQAGYLDRYPMYQGSMVAFPGSGTDYPLQPGESVLIANDAANHKELSGSDACPDLSKADWEIYLKQATRNEVDYPVRDMDDVYYSSFTIASFAQGLFNGGYIIAKCPEGMTPQQFVEDTNNFTTTPGTTSTNLILLMPSKYVIDAVMMWDSRKSEFYGNFLPQDDAKGILSSTSNTGKCIRRKVSKIENGRVYYQDTNNSANDFLNNQPLTPGVTPTSVD